MGPKKQIAIKGGIKGPSSSRPKNLARKRKRTPEPDEVTLGRSPTPSPPSAFCPSPLSPGSIPVLARLERDLAHHNRKPKALWEHAAVKKPRDYRVIRGRGHYPSVSIIIKTFPVFLN